MALQFPPLQANLNPETHRKTARACVL